MTRRSQKSKSFKVIAKLLASIKELNIEAGGSSELSDALSSLSRYLALTPHARIMETLASTELRTPPSQMAADVESLDGEQLDALISDSETSRAVLEAIAIKRFGVPSGSMRSFSNIRLLREKLQTLVENERAHEVISAAAKRSS